MCVCLVVVVVVAVIEIEHSWKNKVALEDDWWHLPSALYITLETLKLLPGSGQKQFEG